VLVAPFSKWWRSRANPPFGGDRLITATGSYFLPLHVSNLAVARPGITGELRGHDAHCLISWFVVDCRIARSSRIVIPDISHRLTQRGDRRQALFTKPGDHAVGDAPFIARAERQLGRSLRRGRPGPKPRIAPSLNKRQGIVYHVPVISAPGAAREWDVAAAGASIDGG
jgi:hypothetical protein